METNHRLHLQLQVSVLNTYVEALKHPTHHNDLIKFIIFYTSDRTRVNKSADYVLCKPASHATNMELKYKKSPGEYEGNITKPPHTIPQKVPLPEKKEMINNTHCDQCY